MIIGLSGYAQSGKDTIASILVEKHGWKRVAFADKIKEFAEGLDITFYDGARLQDLVKADGWDKAKRFPDVRGLLQDIGVSARNTFGEYFWVDQALAQVLNDETNYVITDVRFPNEVEAIKSMGGKVGLISRLGVNAVNEHVSEHALANSRFDFRIENDGDLKELEETVDWALSEWLSE